MANGKRAAGKAAKDNGLAQDVAKGERRSIAAKSETDFDQGGPDGASKQRAGAKAKDHNGKEFTEEQIADQVSEYLELLDETDSAVEANNRECKLKNQPLRKKASKAAASLIKDGVVSTQVLAKHVAAHRTQRKLDRIDHTLNDEQKAEFASIKRGLAGLVGTPLGDAALRTAEAARPH